MDELKYIGILLAVLLVLLLPAACMFGWKAWKNNIHGNRMQFTDLRTEFDVAYILGDGGRFERRRIKAWYDWKDSDAVQVILEDGTPVYTHLRNVKLAKEAK